MESIKSTSLGPFSLTILSLRIQPPEVPLKDVLVGPLGLSFPGKRTIRGNSIRPNLFSLFCFFLASYGGIFLGLGLTKVRHVLWSSSIRYLAEVPLSHDVPLYPLSTLSPSFYE